MHKKIKVAFAVSGECPYKEKGCFIENKNAVSCSCKWWLCPVEGSPILLQSMAFLFHELFRLMEDQLVKVVRKHQGA